MVGKRHVWRGARQRRRKRQGNWLFSFFIGFTFPVSSPRIFCNALRTAVALNFKAADGVGRADFGRHFSRDGRSVPRWSRVRIPQRQLRTGAKSFDRIGDEPQLGLAFLSPTMA